jgi:septal ring factor EnvC (AmiA/AmiB activator)
MLTAVWVAIVVAAAFWAIAVCAGVYVMMRAARLINQTTAVVTSLRQRSETLMDEAEAVTRRASEQVGRTEAIATSMDEVTTSMAELNQRLTGLGPAARSLAEGAGLPLTKIAAFTYGVARAVGMRRARAERAAGGARRAAGTGALAAASAPAPPPAAVRRRSRTALAGRRNEVAG